MLGRRRFPGDVFHVDLLGPARRLWSARLADCRLGTVEQDVLGFLRDDDLPGALIPTVYFEYLRRKRPDELPRVFEHNRHDILSLAALTGWVADAVVRAPLPDFEPEALAGLGRLLELSEPAKPGLLPPGPDTGLPTRRASACCGGPLREAAARWDEARALGGRPARPGADPRPWGETPRSTSTAGAISAARRSWAGPRARPAPRFRLGGVRAPAGAAGLAHRGVRGPCPSAGIFSVARQPA